MLGAGVFIEFVTLNGVAAIVVNFSNVIVVVKANDCTVSSCYGLGTVQLMADTGATVATFRSWIYNNKGMMLPQVVKEKHG